MEKAFNILKKDIQDFVQKYRNDDSFEILKSRHALIIKTFHLEEDLLSVYHRFGLSYNLSTSTFEVDVYFPEKKLLLILGFIETIVIDRKNHLSGDPCDI